MELEERINLEKDIHSDLIQCHNGKYSDNSAEAIDFRRSLSNQDKLLKDIVNKIKTIKKDIYGGRRLPQGFFKKTYAKLLFL